MCMCTQTQIKCTPMPTHPSTPTHDHTHTNTQMLMCTHKTTTNKICEKQTPSTRPQSDVHRGCPTSGYPCLLCTHRSFAFAFNQINRSDYQLDPVHLHHRTEKDWFQARRGCTHADDFPGKLDLLVQLRGGIDADRFVPLNAEHWREPRAKSHHEFYRQKRIKIYAHISFFFIS